MAVFVVPRQVPEVHGDVSKLFIDQRHVGKSRRTHRNVLFLLFHFCTIEVCMEFRISLLFGGMLIAQAFHYFIQGNGVKRLHDLQSVSGRKLHRLLLDALKEIALNASYIDLLERTDLIFPLHDESSLVQDPP